jgi:hypothetical protein
VKSLPHLAVFIHGRDVGETSAGQCRLRAEHRDRPFRPSDAYLDSDPVFLGKRYNGGRHRKILQSDARAVK